MYGELFLIIYYRAKAEQMYCLSIDKQLFLWYIENVGRDSKDSRKNSLI